MPKKLEGSKIRIKRDVMVEAFNKLLVQIVPGDKQGRTVADVIAFRVCKKAVKGDLRAAIEIADRIGGKTISLPPQEELPLAPPRPMLDLSPLSLAELRTMQAIMSKAIPISDEEDFVPGESLRRVIALQTVIDAHGNCGPSCKIGSTVGDEQSVPAEPESETVGKVFEGEKPVEIPAASKPQTQFPIEEIEPSSNVSMNMALVPPADVHPNQIESVTSDSPSAPPAVADTKTFDLYAELSNIEVRAKPTTMLCKSRSHGNL